MRARDDNDEWLNGALEKITRKLKNVLVKIDEVLFWNYFNPKIRLRREMRIEMSSSAYL